MIVLWFFIIATLLLAIFACSWLNSQWSHMVELSERVERLEKRDLESAHHREEVRKGIEAFEAAYGPLDAVEASDAEPLSEATLRRLRKAFAEDDR